MTKIGLKIIISFVFLIIGFFSWILIYSIFTDIIGENYALVTIPIAILFYIVFIRFLFKCITPECKNMDDNDYKDNTAIFQWKIFAEKSVVSIVVFILASWAWFLLYSFLMDLIGEDYGLISIPIAMCFYALIIKFLFRRAYSTADNTHYRDNTLIIKGENKIENIVFIIAIIIVIIALILNFTGIF